MTMENDGLRMLMELDAKVASLDVGSLSRGVEAARKLAVGFETALGKVYSAAPAARLAMDGWSEPLSRAYRETKPVLDEWNRLARSVGFASLAAIGPEMGKYGTRSGLEALARGMRPLEPFLKLCRDYEIAFGKGHLKDFHDLTNAAFGPSMALAGLCSKMDDEPMGGLFCDPAFKQAAILSWSRPALHSDAGDEICAAILHPASSTPPSPGGLVRRIDVRVAVKCARCGGDLLVRDSRYDLNAETDIDLRLNVVPWCTCMSSWDGTREDLTGPAGEEQPPLRLVPLEGQGEGDGIPAGSLALVRREDDSTDSSPERP
jgi:hypothetical protein